MTTARLKPKDEEATLKKDSATADALGSKAHRLHVKKVQDSKKRRRLQALKPKKKKK